MSALLLGSLMGYLPLVWVALGLILNGVGITIAQTLLRFLFPTWSQVVAPSGSVMCEIFAKVRGASSAGGVTTVAPSHWMGAAVFFAVFTIYNSIRVALKPAATGAPAEKVSNRVALSLSTLAIGICFLVFVFLRGFTGCETWLGGITGAMIGGGLAIGYWHMLDVCGAGTVPDVLQVMTSLAPTPDTPVVCVPPAAADGN
jgi:hypothetical protein